MKLSVNSYYIGYICSEEGCRRCKHPVSTWSDHHKLIRADGLDLFGYGEEIQISKKKTEVVLKDQPVFAVYEEEAWLFENKDALAQGGQEMTDKKDEVEGLKDDANQAEGYMEAARSDFQAVGDAEGEEKADEALERIAEVREHIRVPSVLGEVTLASIIARILSWEAAQDGWGAWASLEIQEAAAVPGHRSIASGLVGQVLRTFVPPPLVKALHDHEFRGLLTFRGAPGRGLYALVLGNPTAR
jgi:hypothetical protein